ncbi:uncharacterized protein involved in type VI secretion and phage assembly [Pedobacter cryoconitis]|uniref:Uncharacterized protein involved in type VI secretion and phage assembly n=1 Tax=Pedobacter cryoconitis TaxID=188932 RepID=A0A7W8YPP3_9SPHI|nr:phage baseplate assembly protein V [Pedobacter cryoconitis]MBB5619542.1 uncharacterized protein involved in type VI secretion and phage assembly [Pedobacter cryoconitis]
MENNLIKEISIGDKTISHFSSFTLQQHFNAHHYFELRFNHDEMGAPGLINLDNSRDFVGKTLSASFGYVLGKQQVFAGLVTKVELTQSNGYHGVLVVSGYSPTILIDRGPDLGSYLDKDLSTIVQLATHDTPDNDLRIVTNATRKTPIDYVIQYRESDFEFLNRLSGEYHEWFFYDGMNLNFGKPDTQKEVSLFYGRDVNSLQYAMEVAPIKNKRFAYNPKQDEMLQSESSGKADGRPDLVHAINASNTTYSKTFNQPSLVRVDNGSDIKNLVDNEEKANISQLLKISASGDNPEVSLGAIVDITMSLRQEVSFITESLGKFLITSVNHTIDDRGHYVNTFEGLVSTTERLVVKNYKRPNPDMQLADVLDNDDPQGQGRVKVKFKWACQTNDPSEWLRVMSPNAGSGDKGSNRGFHVIPEKGDQVMIAFEEGNIARPVVLGSVYHGKNGDSKGFKNSNVKGLSSRMGSRLTFDDLNHALHLGTDECNFIDITNGNDTVELVAGTKVIIRSGESSITLNSNGTIDLIGKIINIQGTDAINANADPLKGAKVSIGSLGNTIIEIKASSKETQASGKITSSAKGEQKIEGKPVNIN